MLLVRLTLCSDQIGSTLELTSALKESIDVYT